VVIMAYPWTTDSGKAESMWFELLNE
jgi:hypothetical protein